MKTTQEYLEAAKIKLKLPSDYATAKWLNISTAALSQYKTGKRTIDDYAAARIAEALHIDAMEVIAAANFEREKDEKRRAFWNAKFRQSLAACLMVFVVTSVSYDIPGADEYRKMYIM